MIEEIMKGCILHSIKLLEGDVENTELYNQILKAVKEQFNKPKHNKLIVPEFIINEASIPEKELSFITRSVLQSICLYDEEIYWLNQIKQSK